MPRTVLVEKSFTFSNGQFVLEKGPEAASAFTVALALIGQDITANAEPYLPSLDGKLVVRYFFYTDAATRVFDVDTTSLTFTA